MLGARQPASKHDSSSPPYRTTLLEDHNGNGADIPFARLLFWPDVQSPPEPFLQVPRDCRDVGLLASSTLRPQLHPFLQLIWLHRQSTSPTSFGNSSTTTSIITSSATPSSSLDDSPPTNLDLPKRHTSSRHASYTPASTKPHGTPRDSTPREEITWDVVTFTLKLLWS
jgi:hypothetical protein